MSNKKLERLVNDFPTKYEEGFVHKEIMKLVSRFSETTYDEVMEKMGVVTANLRDGQTVYFHCDVLTALRCAIEDREMTVGEWD